MKFLENFLLDGRLEIDNNRSERAIKSFVIGRKIGYSRIHQEAQKAVRSCIVL